jgi:hypothetical protein
MIKLYERYTDGEYSLHLDIRTIEARCGKKYRVDLNNGITIPFEKAKWLLATLKSIKAEMKAKKGYLLALGGKQVERSCRHCDCITSFLDVGVIALSTNMEEAVLRFTQTYPQVKNGRYPSKESKVINITVVKHFTNVLKAVQCLYDTGINYKFGTI